MNSYQQRENSIKCCINEISSRVITLKEEKSKTDDYSVAKELKKEQNRLRLMKNELNVEEVVKERSLKVCFINIRC